MTDFAIQYVKAGWEFKQSFPLSNPAYLSVCPGDLQRTFTYQDLYTHSNNRDFDQNVPGLLAKDVCPGH